jgi:hypothetical protein
MSPKDEDNGVFGTEVRALYVQLVSLKDSNEEMVALTIDHDAVYLLNVTNALKLCDAIQATVQERRARVIQPGRKDN